MRLVAMIREYRRLRARRIGCCLYGRLEAFGRAIANVEYARRGR